KMTQKEFLKHAGSKCPYCKSYNIQYSGTFEPYGGEGFIDIRCSDCGKAWTEKHKLTGYTEEEGKE
ncbi:MAG: hypothetical protein ACTSPI_00260, partial [Candidatus Heimdallarchaeaceae archaeon]